MSSDQKKTGLARSMRKDPAPAEAILWRCLRNRQLAGFKFRRQHPVGTYIVDFACVECKLIVEVDGVSHLDRRRQDRKRTGVLESEGWEVVRFWNTEVYDELESVAEAIYQRCAQRKPAPDC